ncbi:hypothetical protein pb186bvf_001479 [Paramecium bursaria]
MLKIELLFQLKLIGSHGYRSRLPCTQSMNTTSILESLINYSHINLTNMQQRLCTKYLLSVVSHMNQNTQVINYKKKNCLMFFFINLFICQDIEYKSPIDIQYSHISKHYKLELRFHAQEMTAIKQNDSFILNNDKLEFRIFGHDAYGQFVGYQPSGIYRFQLGVSLYQPSLHKIHSIQYDLEIEIMMDLLKIYKHSYIRAGLTILFIVDSKVEWNNIISSVNDQNITFNMIELMKQLKHVKNYFTYMGSETFQPCKDDVNRFIISAPLKISQQQLDHLKKFTRQSTIAVYDTRHRQIQEGTLILDDQYGYNQTDRFFALIFMALLFGILFALFVQEQKQQSKK